ncbi:hypothetical protein LUZ63_020411 [Rhynchospora breviuscula]|uniref:ribose-phosphate diphosphokinase n=1 Tax=Rhynchospora breviuscula TaxID=2022672 RepID=A0A9P9ZA58_9POAL|nr:hypothetical protein LUZ63_020411 [Rhynchospora breviuscula]
MSRARLDVQFPSGADTCAAWLYVPERPAGPRRPPVVVLGHGLGGVREMRLDAVAERFAEAGLAALVFDYRHFGASGGEPRQLLSVRRQLADWDAAVAYAAQRPEVDGDRVAIWGSSFGGGHVLAVAARHPELMAVVSQCPFTDGPASSLALGPAGAARLLPAALRDLAAAARGRPPVTVPLAGEPGTTAMMTTPDALPGYLALVPEGSTFRNEVAARLALRITAYRPGRLARRASAPVMVSVCEHDGVAPPGPTLRHARRAPRGEVRTYPVGHFDVYRGEAFEQVNADQTAGTAHRGLAREVCDRLGVPLSPVDLVRFSNDCLQAQLQANCRQRDVYLVQPLVPPTQEHLMELLLMIDAARGASAGSITAVVPHYAYARSDKKDASRISLGGRLVADLLATAGVDRVITMTLHAPQVHGFFSVPVDQLTALGVLADHFLGQDLTDAVVVSPDLGNAKVATQFARLLGLPVAAGSKQRLADDRVVIDSIVGDVSGRRAIVLDDEIATGGSIVELLDKLAEAGCERADVACTHGLFVGKAVERLRGHPRIGEVVSTDTVPPPADWPELRVLSVAGLFAEAISRVHAGESISSLFDGVDPTLGPPQPRLFD